MTAMNDDARWVRIQMWKPLREVFQAADALFEEAERSRDAAVSEGAASPAGRAVTTPSSTPPAAYLQRRYELHELIQARLAPTLIDHVGPWQQHMCMSAIISFIDERERVSLGALAASWNLPLFQRELLAIDDGGDRWFEHVHDLLARPDVHALVFEIYLLCLRAGFVGRYRDRRHELDKLGQAIVARLGSYPNARPAPTAIIDPGPPRRRVGFVGFPLRYYLGLATVLVALFVGLRVLSAREVSRTSLARDCRQAEGRAP